MCSGILTEILITKLRYLFAITALTYIKQHLETMAHERDDQQTESSDEEDFFYRPISRRLRSPVELDGYLVCATDTMELLLSFSAIKMLSLKLNTALPASAACEWLFSCAGQIFTAERSRIDSVNLLTEQKVQKVKCDRNASMSKSLRQLPACCLQCIGKSLNSFMQFQKHFCHSFNKQIPGIISPFVYKTNCLSAICLNCSSEKRYLKTDILYG